MKFNWYHQIGEEEKEDRKSANESPHIDVDGVDCNVDGVDLV